jgi:hypothetical protein
MEEVVAEIKFDYDGDIIAGKDLMEIRVSNR